MDESHGETPGVATSRGTTDNVGGWVLEGNERSQRFLTSRGWINYGI